MEDKKRYSKIKMFIFLAFAILGLVLIVQVANIVQDGIQSINEKNVELKCIDLSFEINEFNYENQRISFELLSSDYDTNISKVAILTDFEIEYEKNFNPSLRGGASQFIIFNNVTLEKSLNIYVNDCKNKGVEKEI